VLRRRSSVPASSLRSVENIGAASHDAMNASTVGLGLERGRRLLVADPAGRPGRLVFHAGGPADQDEPADPFGRRERRVKGEAGPERVPQQVEGFGAARLEQEGAPGVEVHPDVARVAMAGQVHRYGASATPTDWPTGPTAARSGEPVREHERRALTDRLGVQGGHER